MDQAAEVSTQLKTLAASNMSQTEKDNLAGTISVYKNGDYTTLMPVSNSSNSLCNALKQAIDANTKSCTIN